MSRSLNLGFETLVTQTTPMSVEDYCEMFEEFATLDQAIAQDEVRETKIQMAMALLENAGQLPEDQKKVVYDFLGQDPIMAKAIEASEEGQKLQDFFRWGLGGLVIGLYLGSFGRIRKCLSSPTLAPSKHSQYLFPEKYVDQFLKGCDSMLDAIISGKSERIIKELQTNGVKVDTATDTDWMAVLGSIGANIVGGMIFPFGGAVIGDILGKFLSEKVRTNAQEHGYTQENFAKHSKQIIALIDKLSEAKSKQFSIDDQSASKVAKKMLKMVCQGVSTVGRGFCAVCA